MNDFDRYTIQALPIECIIKVRADIGKPNDGEIISSSQSYESQFEKRRQQQGVRDLIGGAEYDECATREIILASVRTLSSKDFLKTVTVARECGVLEIDVVLSRCMWACTNITVDADELHDVLEESLSMMQLDYAKCFDILKESLSDVTF